jgi:hypothetical protein
MAASVCEKVHKIDELGKAVAKRVVMFRSKNTGAIGLCGELRRFKLSPTGRRAGWRFLVSVQLFSFFRE